MSYGHASRAGSSRSGDPAQTIRPTRMQTKPTPTKKLGQLLLERGWITRGVLDRALAAQSALGGRLGTCLLDSGAVNEEQLLELLALQHRVEGADLDDLRGVPEEIYGLIPERLALRHQAVPIRRLGNQVEVAMADPENLVGRDEISFAASKRVVARVALEVRIAEALERYYGAHSSARMTRLLDRLNRSRYLWAEPEERIASRPPAGGNALFPEAPRLTEPALPEIDLDLPLWSESPAPAPPQSSRPPRAEPQSSLPPRAEPASAGNGAALPPAAATAEERLATAADRDQVGRELLAVLRRSFERAALFAARSEAVHGWMGTGRGLDPERLAAFRVPFDQPSVFLNLRRGSGLHLGPLPPMPAHRELARCWHDEPAASCFLMPVSIRGHLAAVLYGDRAGRSLGGLDLAALRKLGAAAADALERCIVLKKQSQG